MDILALSKINALKKSGGVGFDETKTSTYTFTKFGVCIGDDEYRYTKVSEEPVDLKTISKMTIFDPAYENVAGVPYAEHTSFTYVSEDGVDCLLDSIGAFIFAYSFPQALDDIEKGFYIVSSMNENLFEKVVLECETIHTIDPKYLPSGGGGGIPIIDLSDVVFGEPRIDLTEDQVKRIGSTLECKCFLFSIYDMQISVMCSPYLLKGVVCGYQGQLAFEGQSLISFIVSVDSEPCIVILENPLTPAE